MYPGAIYVVRSEVYKKNIYKIGYSTQGEDGIKKRYNTSLGYTDIVYYHEFPSNYKEIEKIIHQRLELYRMYPRRELFNVNWNIINYNLSLVDGRYETYSSFHKWWIDLCHCI